MTENARWLSWSAAAVERAADGFRLVINPDNLRRGLYSRIEDLEAALPKAILDREAIPYEAAFLAGKCFLAYRQRGGTKRSPLPDFYRRPRGDCRVSPANPRCGALSQLL